MSYLLDTMVVSESIKRNRHPKVIEWIAAHVHDTAYLSVVSLGEVQRGIDLLARRDPARAAIVGAWFEDVMSTFQDRTIVVDLAVSREWGRLSARLGRTDLDLVIAATALVHGLTIVTRNLRHFERTGAAVVDPYA